MAVGIGLLLRLLFLRRFCCFIFLIFQSSERVEVALGDRFELFLKRGKFGFGLVAALKESLVASFRLSGELVVMRDVVFGRFAFEEFYFYSGSVRFEDVL